MRWREKIFPKHRGSSGSSVCVWLAYITSIVSLTGLVGILAIQGVREDAFLFLFTILVSLATFALSLCFIRVAIVEWLWADRGKLRFSANYITRDGIIETREDAERIGRAIMIGIPIMPYFIVKDWVAGMFKSKGG